MDTQYHIVILPGWGGSHETWQDFVDLLSKKYETTVIDLPCFGTAPCPDRAWHVVDYAEYVQKQIVALGEKKKQIVLLGHSFGGQVAVAAVARYPDLCGALMLSGAAVYRPKRYIKRALLWLAAKIGKLVFRVPFIERFDVWAKKVLYRTADSPDYEKTSGIKRDIFRHIIREDVSDELANIQQHTLVLAGEGDQYVPVRYSKRIAKHLPHSRFVRIPNGGHGIHLHQQAQLFDAIDTFLSSV